MMSGIEIAVTSRLVTDRFAEEKEVHYQADQGKADDNTDHNTSNSASRELVVVIVTRRWAVNLRDSAADAGNSGSCKYSCAVGSRGSLQVAVESRRVRQLC